MLRATLVAVAAGVVCGDAWSSVGVTAEPFSKPTLRVDARGNAEVSWVGVEGRERIVVPPSGAYFRG